MLKLSLSAVLLAAFFCGCGGESNCCSGDTDEVVSDIEQTSKPEVIKFPPSAVISYKSLECAKGSNIFFDARSSTDEDGYIKMYQWLLDGVVVANDPNPTFVCDKAGLKRLCLRVSDNDNLTSEEVCQEYIVKAKSKIAPVAIIDNLAQTCTEGESVSIIGNRSGDIDGEIITFNWNFGDLNSTKMDPAFICPKEGKYEVCLEVTDNDSLKDKTCTSIASLSIPNKPPKAIIQLPQHSCVSGESIEINATQSSDPDGNISEYIWSMSMLQGQKPLFVCDDPGDVPVCLRVVDDKGLSSQPTCIKITVAKPANKPPIARIAGIGSECTLGDKILADATTSSDIDGQVTGFLWSVDDNASASTQAKPIFVCQKEGIKKICLSVIDNDGEKSQNIECKEIAVKQKLVQTIPPVAKMNLGEDTGDGVYFECKNSYDPDNVDGDNNVQNDGKIIKHEWLVTKTFKDGSIIGPHKGDKCPKWIGTPENLDFMEVILTVTDDDGESTTVKNIYDWKDNKLILRQ